MRRTVPDVLHALAWPMLAAFGVVMLAQVAPAVADSLADVVTPVPPDVLRPAPLEFLGLFPNRLFAGLCGGYVHMLRSARRGTTYAAWVRRIVAGAIMGNYLPVVAAILLPGVNDLPAAAFTGAAFLFGYSGELIMSRFERRIPADAPTV